MQRLPGDELRHTLSFVESDDLLDLNRVNALRKQMAEEFRDQLVIGAPTNSDEAGLRRLRDQLCARKVEIKLFLRYPLHAKLYLVFREDKQSPRIGFVGSSNLTLPGMSRQGELNLDVLEHDATTKLEKWFEDRWNDTRAIDITDELAEIIDASWAREEPVPPFHIYLKMAFHLSQEARAGLAEFAIPRDLASKLFEFQVAAVKIAAHHLNKRGGVLIGDVVGLGKTLMATALARTFQDDQATETLILCPKNLVPMWEEHVAHYRLIARVMSMSQAINLLPELQRYRVVLIDESHNLRNPEGKRYRAIRDYIERNASRCILLTATPYNKSYRDLSAQLRLFVPEDRDIGIRPELKIAQMGGEVEFQKAHQAGVRTLAAFEKSEFSDDWRELMRLYMVRRTRSFIETNYALTDDSTGRRYLTLSDGTPSWFPRRVPRTAQFTIHDDDPTDQYARLYAPDVVAQINDLKLPRYGLGNYVLHRHAAPPDPSEATQLKNLGRAGQRLMGFSRTNLFKRLESGGPAFLQSIERHAVRNFVYLHALEQALPLPIGPQEAALLDSAAGDLDPEVTLHYDEGELERDAAVEDAVEPRGRPGESEMKGIAERIYNHYRSQLRSRFQWLDTRFFATTLARDLLTDAQSLLAVLDEVPVWDSDRDAKLGALLDLIKSRHPDEKILVFSQFADTVDYLTGEMRRRGIDRVAGVTGSSESPTHLAWRFSPRSNDKTEVVTRADELRVLVATDVLSEGQNLQDCHVVVNYDLPWAIIRLVQRAGRVDRIGQAAQEILCYSFLPADGVERLLRLRRRVRQRLDEAAAVVGTDERFFEDDMTDVQLVDLYHEKAGVLDGEEDNDVDLASYAYQIWKNAIDEQPALADEIPNMPNVAFSSKAPPSEQEAAARVLVYLRTGNDTDVLARLDMSGNVVSQSQLAILREAECGPDEPALARHELHHEAVAAGVRHVAEDERSVGGSLGPRSGPRFKAYDRLQRYARAIEGGIWDTDALRKAIDSLYRYPLTETGKERLSRQLRAGVSDEELASMTVLLWEDDRLSVIEHDGDQGSPQIICSLGVHPKGQA
jgi:superfamily II DNA or RNA helicase